MSTDFLTTAVNALKKDYLPAWDNQIGIEPSPFIAEIKKVALTGGEEFVTAGKKGLSGGFGFGANEGNSNAPVAGGMMYEQFKAPIMNMYATIEIPDRALKLSSANAFFDLFNEEVQGAYDAFSWNIGRSVHGKADGKLCQLMESVDVSDATSFKVDDIKFLKEGLIVDLYANGATTKSATCRITNVGRTASSSKYTIGCKFIGTGSDITISGTSYGFVTVQNSYAKELTGIYDILDTTSTYIYGVARSGNDYLSPVGLDMGTGADQKVLTDDDIDKVLTRAEREKGSKVNMLLFGDDAYSAYIRYLRSINKRIENDLVLAGGHKAVRFAFGGRDVAIVKDEFVKNSDVIGVNTEDWEFHKTELTPVAKDGAMFERLAGSTSLQAVLACYGNIICKKPGGCIHIKNADKVSA